MIEGRRSIILVDLIDPGEFQRLAAVLREEGFEVVAPSASEADSADGPRTILWLDEEVRRFGADFVLVDAPRWKGLGADGRHSLRSYVIVVLFDADGDEGTDASARSGSFDGILRAPGWEEGAAAYFKALSKMWNRFSGAFGRLERRYESLVNALPDIVYELDDAGRFTFVNNSIRLLGYEPSELTGRHFSVLLHEDDARNVDRDAVLSWFKGAQTGPALSPKLFNERRSFDRRTENLELRIKRKPPVGTDDIIGSVIAYGEVTAAGEYGGEEGGFVASVGVIRDITLRRKSEDMLRKLYQAVDQLGDGILIVDRSFGIEYANPAFLRMTGREPTEVIGQRLFPFFEADAARAAEMAALVREGFDVREELPCRLPSGEFLWTAMHISPVRVPTGDLTHAIIVCEDVSQTRAMADLLRTAKEEAERADRAKSDFLASMGHELKGPLASILAAARLIEMGGADPEKRARSIIGSAQGLLDLLGDILDFVRFETGAGTLRRLSFPLAGFVIKACEPWRKRSLEKGLAFEIGPLPEANISSDPDRLGRAFAALLGNAVAFTESGMVRVEARIESRSGNLPYLVLSVRDTGLGISAEDQGRIFAPFVQLGSPYSKTVGGAGIGLSLARNIVRALGGEVRLESEPGKGSLFSILVPAAELEAAETVPVQVGVGPRVYRILVVDDNEVNLDYMAALLGNAGHQVERAGSGAAALQLLDETQPDAALLDIQMPGMSGIELGRRVRSYSGDRYDAFMPLIALTAFGPEEVARSSVDFDRILSKPADIPALLAALEAALLERDREPAGFFAQRWAGRPSAGAVALARAELELPPFFAAMRKTALAGEREGLRQSAQSIVQRIATLGAHRAEAALHRFAFAATFEKPEILATRAERFSSLWGHLLEECRAELRKMEEG